VVLTWGSDGRGQLGDGKTADSGRPIKINVTLTGNAVQAVRAIGAGVQHSLGLVPEPTSGSNKVATWGDNSRGQSPGGGVSGVPAGVTGTESVTAVAAGSWHCVALQQDETVVAWGDNVFGQLGDGTNTPRGTSSNDKPVRPVLLLGGIVRVAAGGFHTLALMSNGRLLAWGANDSGQLGDGTTVDRALPVLVRDLGDAEVVDIAAGMDFSVALLADGSVLTWGGNDHGQLGDGTRNRRLTPVQVADPDASGRFLTGVAAVTAGSSHVLALR
jgi:alpha-tubulin suppressor-like RCC1 family protein